MSQARLLLSIAVVLQFAPLDASAQERRAITGEGTEGFRALLAQKGLAPIETSADLKSADPARVLLIMFRGADENGDERPHGLEQLGINLKEFVERGGAFLVATDLPIPNDPPIDLNEDFGGSVERDIILAQPSYIGYKRQEQFPFVARAPGAEPNLFQRFKKPDEISNEEPRPLLVATNRPSCLGPSRALDTIAVFPRGTWKFAKGSTLDRDLPFAQSKLFPGSGRFMLMADHSVFINSMLLPQRDPNDNLAFASNCIDWMMKSSGGNRNYVLFIEDGKIYSRRDYDLMLQAMPSPRPEDIAGFLWDNREYLWDNADLAEGVLAQIEEDGIFGELEKSDPLGNILSELFDRWMIARFLLIVGAVALLGYGARAMMGSKHRFPTKVPRVSTVLDRMRPRTGLLDLRLRSGLGKGQFFELARERARASFADLGVAPGDGGAPPAVTIDAGWWERGRIAQDLREVWAVAYGQEPTAISARQWGPFQKKLSRLATLIEARAIRFG